MVLYLVGLLYKWRRQRRIDHQELEAFLKVNLNHEVYSQETKKLRKYYKKLLIFLIFISIFLPYFWAGMCVNSFQEFVSLKLGTVVLTWSWLRALQLPYACLIGPPRHIYATIPEDASNSVIINAHTNIEYDAMTILYDTEEY